jgi:Mg-chelatase subunit ChlD
MFFRGFAVFVFLASLVVGQDVEIKPRTATPSKKVDDSKKRGKPGFVTLRPNLDGNPIFESNANYVFVSATVRDGHGQFVYNLKKEDFRLKVDKQDREIVEFKSDEGPIAVVFLLDISFSMKPQYREPPRNPLRRLDDEISRHLQKRPNREERDRLTPGIFAIKQFLDNSFSHPTLGEDVFALVKFSDKVRLAQPFTAEKELIAEKVEDLEAHGDTGLFDGLIKTGKMINQYLKDGNLLSERRFVVAITDGGENASIFSTLGKVLNYYTEADAMVCAVGMIVEKTSDLEEVAKLTGGCPVIVAKTEADISAAVQRMSKEMHHVYTIGFKAQDPDNLRHNVQVVVANQPNYIVGTARRSFMGSGQ